MKRRRKRDKETRGGGGGEISEVVDVCDDAVAVSVDTQWLVDFCAGDVLEFPRRGGRCRETAMRCPQMMNSEVGEVVRIW